MINKRKVRLMTRTAMYEKHEGVKDLPKAKYYKGDYVRFNMWKTAIALTMAYLLILFLVGLYNFEYIILNLTLINYTTLGITIAMIYIGLMILFLLIAYFVYSIGYDRAEKGINLYTKRLQKIFQLNKSDKRQKKKGGASE